jgi:hypothetical protein
MAEHKTHIGVKKDILHFHLGRFCSTIGSATTIIIGISLAVGISTSAIFIITIVCLKLNFKLNIGKIYIKHKKL